MLGRPAWYKKTYENNSDRLRTNLDPFIGVLGFPVETIMKADKKLTVVICSHLFDYRYLAAISGGGRCHPRPVD